MIVGLRFRIGGSNRGCLVSYRVLDREPVKVANGDSFWYDVGLSDVEAIYASQNSLDLTFSTSDVKKCPIKLYNVQVYVSTMAEFDYSDKVARHLKELYKQIESKK